MENKSPKDFTPIIQKISDLSEFVKELRESFPFTQNDRFGKKEKEFLKHWRHLQKKQNAERDQG